MTAAAQGTSAVEQASFPRSPAARVSGMRAVFVALVGAAFAYATWITLDHLTVDTLQLISFGWSGVLFVTAGFVAWDRRPENRSGKLMVVGGASLLTMPLALTSKPILFSLWVVFGAPVWAPIIIYLFLAYPRGRLNSRAMRFLVLAVFIGTLIEGPLMNLFTSARACPSCPELNLLLIHRSDALVRWIGRFVDFPYGAPLQWLLAGIFAVRLWRSKGPSRRVIWPVYVPLSIWLAYQPLSASYFIFGFPRGAVFKVIANVTGFIFMLVPLTFLFGLLRMRSRRSRVGELVVELGRSGTPQRLQESLARTLGDPTVEVGFWSPDRGHYVTAEGATLNLPAKGDARIVTRLERVGQPLAVIVHDPALLEEPQLVDSVFAAARLAIENEQLAAEVRAQLAEVRASRVRMVEAADDARRRIERDLHDGAQQRLVSLAMSIRIAKAKAQALGDSALIEELDQSAAGLDRAVADLRRLAQGIHPAVLTEEGLDAALNDLIEASPLRVRLSVEKGRFPAPVEATAYFVVAEALANTAKHAGASVVSVNIAPAGGTLVVQITDDGIGGADIAKGSGLRGLQDRVAALGGTLRLYSPATGGTRVAAEIPCTVR
jgi:signal transduction histidine kinase